MSHVLKPEADSMNALGGDRFCLDPKMGKKSDFHESIADFLLDLGLGCDSAAM